ncbi:MAG TPA: tRNA lysidine(34) synthetase TilS [Candidatus Eremiobacteraceae bacterium]|nr:tRNA lysidine(34) synthetase TilS [Candidatus Eremiobacteraceae bacterium]
MRETLVQRVLSSINMQNFSKAGDRVCVAVSGGADSVALFLLLSELRGNLGIALSVAHFNHKLRGKTSDADEAFVRKLAERLELPFHSDSADVGAQAKREKTNLEDTGRRARYSFFARLVSEGHATRIAVAHTADDQAETVLAHILRGTGLAGLGGIAPVAGPVFRPLLEFRREELRAYLRARKQTWREDATNRDTTRMRARIRKILLPLLEKKFQPAVVEHLSTLASLAREDEACLKRIAERFVVSRSKISKGEAKIVIADLLSPLEENLFGETKEANRAEKNSAEALRKRIIRQLIAAVKARPGQLTAAHTAKTLEFARSGENGKSLQLPGGVEVRRERDSLVVRAAAKPGNQTRILDFSHRIDLNSMETCVRIPELGCSFRFTMIDWPAKRRETIDAGALLDRDRLREPFVLRNRQGGDALRLATFSNGRKLKRLLNDMHVSRWERQGWPVFTSAGVVAWARGFPVAAEFAPGDETRAVLVIAEEKF